MFYLLASIVFKFFIFRAQNLKNHGKNFYYIFTVQLALLVFIELIKACQDGYLSIFITDRSRYNVITLLIFIFIYLFL